MYWCFSFWHDMLNGRQNHGPLFNRPGQIQGLLYKHLRYSIIHSLIPPFPPQLYGAATPEQLEIDLPVIKKTHSDKELSKY